MSLRRCDRIDPYTEAELNRRYERIDTTGRIKLLRRFYYSTITALASFAALLISWSCSPPSRHILTCKDSRVGHAEESPWILRIDEAKHTAEMIVHVPEESIRTGAPEGNRFGHLRVSERAYEITIPADSGGVGEKAWVRMQFSFEIDRFTGAGKVEIGERRYGETLQIPIRCEAGSRSPKL